MHVHPLNCHTRQLAPGVLSPFEEVSYVVFFRCQENIHPLPFLSPDPTPAPKTSRQESLEEAPLKTAVFSQADTSGAVLSPHNSLTHSLKRYGRS